MLVSQIITGVVLAMHYTAHVDLAFGSIEKIMRDVNYGWMIRYLHSNGASMFFIAVYVHMMRGLYYGSYKAPREVLWILGVIIYLLMMATAFLGYVLPRGQMSLWGAVVITNLFSAFRGRLDHRRVPVGGYSVDNPTLNRFFSLHYLLPFMIAGVVILHVWALHVTGQNNPTGVECEGRQEGHGSLHALCDHQGRCRPDSLLHPLHVVRLLPAELSRPRRELRAERSAGDAAAHRAGVVLPALLRDPSRHQPSTST